VKFALSRLIALVFGRAPDENYAVAIIVWLTAACYFFALVPNVAGAVAALLLTPLLLQLPLYATSLFFAPGRPHDVANSRLLFTLMLLASAYFATTHSWVRFVAWAFIALFAINAIAAIAMRLVERR